jgi:hypothetical protein
MNCGTKTQRTNDIHICINIQVVLLVNATHTTHAIVISTIHTLLLLLLVL